MREADAVRKSAPFPARERAALSDGISRAGDELGVCLSRKRDWITGDGRFATELQIGGNVSGSITDRNQVIRQIRRRVCFGALWQRDNDTSLRFKTRLQVKALKGLSNGLSGAEKKALGLTTASANPILLACAKGCAGLINSGAIATAKGKAEHQIILAAVQAADAPLAKKLEAAGSAGTFNGFKLRPIETLSTSAAGKDFIKRQEGGFEARLYALDGAKDGNCTIGYGHLVHRGKCTGEHPAEKPYLEGITQEQADALFGGDVKIAEGDVKEIFDTGAQVTQPMFDAFVSLLFNIGRKKADRAWQLFVKTRSGDYTAAAKEFLDIDKVTVETVTLNPIEGFLSTASVALPAFEVTIVKEKAAVRGLTERRKRESKLYLNGTYQ